MPLKKYIRDKDIIDFSQTFVTQKNAICFFRPFPMQTFNLKTLKMFIFVLWFLYFFMKKKSVQTIKSVKKN